MTLYFPPDISSDRATIAWTVEKRMKKLTLPKCIRKQEDSHQDHIGKHSGTCTRRAEESIPTPSIDIKNEKKKQNMPEARSDSLLQLTANRGTLIHRASEQAAFLPERWKLDCSTYHRICNGWNQLYSSMQRMLRIKKFSIFEISSSSWQSCEDRTSDWSWSVQICRNFGEGSTSTSTKNQEIQSSGCVYHDELNTTQDNFFLQRVTTEVLEPRHHSNQWAADDREHKKQMEIRQSDLKPCQSQSLYQWISVNKFANWLQQIALARKYY